MSTAKKAEGSPTPNNNPIFDKRVIEAFSNGLRETLQMMAQVDVNFETARIENQWQKVGDVSGLIEFKSPPFAGSIYIHLPKEILFHVYEQMVGEKYTELSKDVLDSIGEISNMAYGVAKGKLNPLGFEFNMSIPKVCLTADLNRVPGIPHLLIPFSIQSRKCQLEILIHKL